MCKSGPWLTKFVNKAKNDIIFSNYTFENLKYFLALYQHWVNIVKYILFNNVDPMLRQRY